MRICLCLVILFLASLLPAKAEDAAMEFQRCVWRCLANSNGPNDPAYPACVTNVCDEGEPVSQSTAQRWNRAPHSGEERRSVIGCSDSTDDENWTCLIVRCDDDGEMNIYFDGTNAARLEDTTLEIDGVHFKVSQGDASGTPFNERLVGDSRGIVAAMKRGSRVKILEAKQWLQSGFEIIHLRGSSKAIGQLESSCRAR